jgi:spermidine synthase
MSSGPAVVLARARGEVGEVVLRTRGEVVELVVDGVFTMDSAHTATEEALASLTLTRLSGDTLRVVVGGLGLGYTAAALLADPRVTRVDVVELDAVLVDWLDAGLLPGLATGTAPDGRLRLRVGNVLDLVPALAPGSVDAVLLDIDNGPGFLVHPGNAAAYQPEFLARAAGVLASDGILAVWSSHAAPGLAAALEAVVGACEEVLLPVERDDRRFDYAIYLARRPVGTASARPRPRHTVAPEPGARRCG